MTPETAAPTRDEMIERVQPLVWRIAHRFAPAPDGYTPEDLVAEANLVLLRRVGEYDPARGALTTFAGHVALNAMRAVRDRANTKARGGLEATLSLQAESPAGERLIPDPVDPRAADPGEIAAVREQLAPARRARRLSVRQLEATLPSPAEVADQVVRLRAAMFGAISEDDVADVMQAMVREAKAGDPKAAKLLIDLLAPARSGVTVNQQVVSIRNEDVT